MMYCSVKKTFYDTCRLGSASPYAAPSCRRVNTAPLAFATLLLVMAAAASADDSEAHIPHGMEMHQGGSNHLAVVLASTDNTDDTAGTFGVEYEYRLSTRFGVGGVLEHAGGDVDATTLLAVVDIHLWQGLALQTGPGIEFLDEEEGDTEEFVYRIGIMYEFHRGRATIAPQVHYDATPDKDSVVAGIAFGISF